MRLTSDFWVAMLVRSVRGKDGFAYLARHGAGEAGAVFIKVYDKAGKIRLYGPAPQVFYESESSGDDRRFIAVLSEADEAQVAQKLERELDFDPDIWVVEIENYDRIGNLIYIVSH